MGSGSVMSTPPLMEVLKLARGQTAATSLVLDEAIKILQNEYDMQTRAAVNELGRAHDGPLSP